MATYFNRPDAWASIKLDDGVLRPGGQWPRIIGQGQNDVPFQSWDPEDPPMVGMLCGVGGFAYPKRLQAFASPVIQRRRGVPSVKLKTAAGLYRYYVGFAFEAEAVFLPNQTHDCSCCEFVQEIARYQFVTKPGKKDLERAFRGMSHGLKVDRNARGFEYGKRDNPVNRESALVEGYGPKPDRAFERLGEQAFADGRLIDYIQARNQRTEQQNAEAGPENKKDTACYYWMFDRPGMQVVQGTLAIAAWRFFGRIIPKECDGIDGDPLHDRFGVVAISDWTNMNRDKPRIFWMFESLGFTPNVPDSAGSRHGGNEIFQGIKDIRVALTPANGGPAKNGWEINKEIKEWYDSTQESIKKKTSPSK